MRIERLFHPGELTAQRRAGAWDRAEVNGRLISETLAEGAVRFLARQPMAVLASRDAAGRVWASVLIGETGFLTAPDPGTLVLDLAAARPSPEDPLWSGAGPGARVGVLAIDLATRRRLRINGRVQGLEGERLRLEVERAYPNCPKYIQRRRLAWHGPLASGGPGETRRGDVPDESHRALIGTADTIFVASGDFDQGLDASHRGGPPGFVRIRDDRHLRIPDYAGNGMFNTLGNFLADARAGIAILDFEGGRTLQLTGRAGVLWDQREEVDVTGGTHRFWEFDIEAWQETPLPRRLRWEFLDRSPHIPAARRDMGESSTE